MQAILNNKLYILYAVKQNNITIIKGISTTGGTINISKFVEGLQNEL